jgi:hypothetical protein
MNPTSEAEDAIQSAVDAVAHYREGDSYAELKIAYAQVKAIAAVALAVDRLATAVEHREPRQG